MTEERIQFSGTAINWCGIARLAHPCKKKGEDEEQYAFQGESIQIVQLEEHVLFTGSQLLEM